MIHTSCYPQIDVLMSVNLSVGLSVFSFARIFIIRNQSANPQAWNGTTSPYPRHSSGKTIVCSEHLQEVLCFSVVTFARPSTTARAFPRTCDYSIYLFAELVFYVCKCDFRCVPPWRCDVRLGGRSGRARADGVSGRGRHPATPLAARTARWRRRGRREACARRPKGLCEGTFRRDFAKGLFEGTFRRDFRRDF